MPIPSNLYAEKVFAEHPVSLWTLDDSVDYLSLISETNRNMYNWVIYGAVATEYPAQNDQPFVDSTVSIIASTGSKTITCISPIIINTDNLNADLATLAMSLFFLEQDQNLSSIEIGYIGDSTEDSQTISVTDASSGSWTFTSSTFSDIPETEDISMLIRFTLKEESVPTTILVNGISFAQWSEEFHLESLGQEKAEMPIIGGVADAFGISAEAYGLQDLDGYYIVHDNRILAKNTGVPLVYGSQNLTSISPHPLEEPSLIIPGQGFLNQSGQYKTYTVEMWLRLDAQTLEPRRVFGPVSSEDGLYVDGNFITLKINGYFASHYISEWYRPMLVHISYSRNGARLLINGDKVIEIPFDVTTVEFPEELNELSYSQDWLGFYAYEDVPQVELDCFSIYSYIVPKTVAKRRFVYGQGVDFPENINSSYNGTSFLIDYPLAKYDNGYAYPDVGRWIQGTSENISATNLYLSPPEYKLPKILFNGQTTEAWLEDMQEYQDIYGDTITLKPADRWSDIGGHIVFNKLSPLNQPVKSFYGIFRVQDEIEEQSLIFVENKRTGDYFSVVVSGGYLNTYTISYRFRSGSSQERVLNESEHVIVNEWIFAGIDIDSFSSKYGKDVASFFGNQNNLKVYVGGTPTFAKTFSGNIDRVGFCNSRNFFKIRNLFDNNGVLAAQFYDGGDEYFGNDENYTVDGELYWAQKIDGGRPVSVFGDLLFDHIASYTLLGARYYNQYVLDIATDSYWEDYIPLTYLGKTAIDTTGSRVYTLDYVQLNIDIAKPIRLTDNNYDTSSSIAKTYISFQYISQGANSPFTAFKEIVPANSNNVITPGDSWLTTKYEFVNGMVVYPPAGVDFKKLAIVVHIEFNLKGTLYQVPKIKSLQLSSKALNSYAANEIGTRLGAPLYPFTRYGIFFDYKGKNPVSISRKSHPYLYLTKNSGLRVIGDFGQSYTRGFLAQINAKRSPIFDLSAAQMSLMYTGQEFPTTPQPLFEIQSANKFIKFFVVSDHPQNLRGRIYAINAVTRQPFDGILLYQNGKLVKEPVVGLEEWNMIGITFANSLSFDSYAGALRVVGPASISNMTLFEETSFQRARAGTLRKWLSVRYNGEFDVQWLRWAPETWRTVLVIEPDKYYGVSPRDLYNSYAGTNKIIVGDDTPTRFEGYRYTAYQNIQRSSNIVSVV
jgi:hypothetical protein